MYKSRKRYTINCYTEEFERKFTKILRQNGISFDEYMELVHVYDELRERGMVGRWVSLNSRAMMIVKILSNILLTYRRKENMNTSSGWILNYSFAYADGVEYWEVDRRAPYFSRFREQDDREILEWLESREE